MQYRIFTIPVKSPADAQDEMNRFLRSHRVLSVDKRFHAEGADPCWIFCAEYMEHTPEKDPEGRAKGKVDYKDVLDERDFEVFSRLRAQRKEIAEREAVPAYTVFTNEQLARMVQLRVRTKAAFEKVPGVGPARTEKYAGAFLPLLEEAFPE